MELKLGFVNPKALVLLPIEREREREREKGYRVRIRAAFGPVRRTSVNEEKYVYNLSDYIRLLLKRWFM